MCGRFNLDGRVKEIRELLKAVEPENVAVKTGEIFPTDIVPVLKHTDGGPQAAAMAWGFPRWDNKGVIFNARSETALAKRMFRKALLQHPALVPTTGFYEWKAEPGQRRKKKFLFIDPHADVLWLAGFFNIFAEKDGPVREHFTILTTEANASMAPYHNRMPVLIRGSEREAWLSGDALETFLNRQPFAVKAERPVAESARPRSQARRAHGGPPPFLFIAFPRTSAYFSAFKAYGRGQQKE